MLEIDGIVRVTASIPYAVPVTLPIGRMREHGCNNKNNGWSAAIRALVCVYCPNVCSTCFVVINVLIVATGFCVPRAWYN